MKDCSSNVATNNRTGIAVVGTTVSTQPCPLNDIDYTVSSEEPMGSRIPRDHIPAPQLRVVDGYWGNPLERVVQGQFLVLVAYVYRCEDSLSSFTANSTSRSSVLLHATVTSLA